MISVRDLLKSKGYEVWHVSPDTSLLEAVRLMEERDIGALLILEHDELKGIISERDFARMVAETGTCILGTSVENYMTKDVITVDIDQTIEIGMRLMTDNHIRHLPVMEKGKVAGMITLGDVVTEILNNKDALIDSLENYIEGTGYIR
jgi:CBS domain-containing protein